MLIASRGRTAIFCYCLFVVSLPIPGRTEDDESRQAIDSLKRHLSQPWNERAPLVEQTFARVSLTRKDAERAEVLLISDHRRWIRRERAKEMQARQLQVGPHKMPFFYTIYGEQPPEGRSLFISLHGGGGTTQAVNDGQWENQKWLYRPKEGVYVAPRAPTNTWNLWHQPHIDQLFDRLIENFVVFENVNSNRVYLLGYSAGGDGVYQLAPRMADRWAAAAMMAGHPNDASPLGLRNTAFAIHVGGRDSAYSRNHVARQWQEKLAKLKKADPDGYAHQVKIYPEKGHWMDGEDAAAVPWMSKYQRTPFPKRIVWQQDDVAHARFYWLALDRAKHSGRAKIQAVLRDQTIQLEANRVTALKIRLNDKMLDLDKPLTVNLGERQLFSGVAKRTLATSYRTLAERGDPHAVFFSELDIDFSDTKAGK